MSEKKFIWIICWICFKDEKIIYTKFTERRVKGNPQAEHFWRKNGFTATGVTYNTDHYTVVVAERKLSFVFFGR